MTSKVIDWAALVKEAWGPAYFEPDVVYIQSNGRESKDTRGQGGIYTNRLEGIDQETFDSANQDYPNILTEDLGRLMQE